MASQEEEREKETIVVLACSDRRLNEFLDKKVEELRKQGYNVVVERSPGAVFQPNDEAIKRIKKDNPDITKVIVYEHYNCGMAEIQRAAVMGELSVGDPAVENRFFAPLRPLAPQLAIRNKSDNVGSLAQYMEHQQGLVVAGYARTAFPGAQISLERTDIPALHPQPQREGEAKPAEPHYTFIIAPMCDSSYFDMTYYAGVKPDHAYFYQKAAFEAPEKKKDQPGWVLDVAAMATNPRFHIGDRVVVYATGPQDMERAGEVARALSKTLGIKNIPVVAPTENRAPIGRKKDQSKG